jgi:hypothetical protein
MEDHIVSYKNDHGPSYRPCGALNDVKLAVSNLDQLG